MAIQPFSAGMAIPNLASASSASAMIRSMSSATVELVHEPHALTRRENAHLGVAIDHGRLREHRCARGHGHLAEAELFALSHGQSFPDQTEQRCSGEAAKSECVLDRPRERKKLPRLFQRVNDLGADHALGEAVDGARHDGVRHLRLQVDPLDGIRDGAFPRQEKARAHGDAARAVGQRRDEAPAVEEAPGAEHRNVHGIDHLRQEQRCGHHARMASALLALRNDGIHAPLGHLFRVAPGADGRHRDHAGVLELLDKRFAGGLRKACHLDARTNEEVHPLVDIGLIRSEIHSERFVGTVLDLRDGLLQLLQRHRRRSENAQSAGLACGRGEARPGHPPHPCLDNRHPDPEQITDSRVQRGPRVRLASVAHALISLLRAACGSSTSRMSLSSSSVGAASRPTSGGTTRANPVLRRISSTVNPG